jgi:MFS family permease
MDQTQAENSSGSRRTSGPFSALLTVSFTGALGFSIVMPFLVFLVHRWGGNALMYGLVGAAYSAFQLIGSPILGRWSDRFGRRRVLLLSQAGTILSWVVVFIAFYLPVETLMNVDTPLLGKFTLTLPLVLLLVARSVDGLTGGDVSVANAYVADITREDERDQRFGKMAAASNVGYIIGPAIAGILGGTLLGFKLPVLVALGVAIIAMVLVAKFLPKSERVVATPAPQMANAHQVMGQEHRACIQAKKPDHLSNLDLIRLPGVTVLMIVYFLVMLAFNFFYVAFPVQAATEMQWSVKQIGVFFSVMSFFMVLVQGPVLSRLSKVWSERRLVSVGSFILALGFLTFAPAIGWMAFAGALLIATGNGFMWASVVALLSRAAGTHQGAVQGLAGSIGAGASILGLVLGGLMYGKLGGWLFIGSSGLIFIVVFLSIGLPSGRAQPKAADAGSQTA